MATGDNMMDLALQITADPTQAQKAVTEFSAQVGSLGSTVQAANEKLGTSYATVAEALKAQGTSARLAQQNYEDLGASAQTAAAEIKAAFGSLEAPGIPYSQQTPEQQAQRSDLQGIIFQQSQDRIKAYQDEAAAAQESATAQQAALEATSAATQRASEPVIVYDRAMRGATASAANWEQAADAELAKLRETMGVSAEAGRVQAASSERAIGAEEQHVATIAELRAQYAGLAEDAARLEAMPFLSAEEQAGLATDRELMAGIQAEAEGMGGTIERVQQRTSLWHSMNQGVIGDFRLMRYSMYAFTTPLMFTYMIPQIEKVASAIWDAFEALAGYDAELKAVEADARAASEAALTAFGQLDASTRIRLSLITDVNQRTRETLQLEAQKAEQQQKDLRGQIDSVNRLKQAQEELHALQEQMAAEGAGYAGTSELERQGELIKEITGLQSQLGPKLSGNLGAALKQLKDDLDKGNKALNQFQVQLNELKEKPEKAAASVAKLAAAGQHVDEVIAIARVHLPPFITDIERLQKALLVPEAKANNTLFAYAEENAQRLQENLKPLEATLKQLGIETPNMTMPGLSAAGQSAMAAQIQQVQQLTAAQRLALPTERELALANRELARDYPNLTAAERAEWAQVMLTSGAYRQHIDEASRVKNSNTMLAGSFNALAMQVRTAFSEMAGQLTGWGGVATRVFDNVFNAISRQIEIEQRHAGVAQLTAAATAKATVDGLKQIAVVKAVVDFAKGLEELAEAFMGHPGAAAAAVQDFAAAALWGTVGAFQVASMAGAFQPGTSGSKAVATAGTSSSASATPPPLASGSASAAARSQSQPGTLIVQFHGPVYGGPSGVKELIGKISDAVTNNREKLVASHTIFGKAIA